MKSKYLAFFLVVSTFFSSCTSSKTTETSTDTSKLTEEKQTIVIISTDYGDMKAVLYNETPLHRDNFVKLIKSGYYDGCLFHRVIKEFMIQGGDPDSKNAKAGQMLGNGGPGYEIDAEFRDNLIHKKGALAAARTGDNINPQKKSSGSQFYIAQGKIYTNEELNMFEQRMGKNFNALQRDTYTSVGGIPFLDYEYTVFGQVVEGLDVIDKIAEVKKDRNDRPLSDIKMTVKIQED
jgi:peptidyl-prolyl cis-trans isomerase B (cyclophilin B)